MYVLLLFYSLILNMKSFKYFKAFNLLSNKIILITDEGIFGYVKESGEQILIENFTLIDSQLDQDYISFAQFPLDKGGYVICRVKQNIYVFSDDLSSKYGSFQVEELSEVYSVIVPYIANDGRIAIVLTFIKDDLLNLIIYILKNNNNVYSFCRLFTHQQYTKNEDNSSDKVLYTGISCHKTISSIYGSLLTCFVLNRQEISFLAINFYNESPYNVYYSNNMIKTDGTYIINCSISPDKSKCLCGYIDFNSYYNFLIYDIEKNSFSTLCKLMVGCGAFKFYTGIKYVKEQNEYIGYCFLSNGKLNMIKFDENFNIKDIDDNSNKSYIHFEYYNELNIMYSSSLIYDNNNEIYSIVYSSVKDSKDTFNLVEIIERQTTKVQIEENCNFQEKINSTSTPSLKDSTLEITSTPISTMKKEKIPQINFSTNLLTEISITIPKYFLQTTLLNIPNSSFLIISNNSNTYIDKNSDLLFYNKEDDIIRGKINKKKEGLENYLDELMEKVEIGKKYEINGDDYNITISPIDDIDFKKTYIDFSLCEEILRKVNVIPESQVLTILQIEIDKMNDKALTNQVEYAIYYENKTKLDLSICKNVQIKINYDIKNEYLLNKSKVIYYSKLGVDIFDKDDIFFNDICYPFSISNSDLILKDRVADIFQNYSLCDNDCKYEEFNVEEMSVICYCSVKLEINTDVSEPIFSSTIECAFKNSNYGVIKCYNLVFKFKDKIQNIGFLLFSFLIICHFICIILYFIYGIESLIIFVYKEMKKNNYIVNLNNPIKKGTISKDLIINSENRSYTNINMINNNSSALINLKKENKNEISEVKQNKKKIFKNNIKIKNPIFIINYKCHKHLTKRNSKYKEDIIYSHKKDKKKNKIKLNVEKSFPGYYFLIQIDANNSIQNKPPKSKYILDNYNYKEAIKYDDRDFWRIYFICLLSKENILNTFFFKSPLEPQYLRISLFIFNYSCDFAFNALFYFNQKISDKYHYEGNNLYYFILINNITITIFSTVFNYILVKCLNILINSKSEIENVFRNEEKLMRKNKKYIVSPNKKKKIFISIFKEIKYLKIKIIFYIIIQSLLMLFFYYYIVAFCEVYKETQKSWIYDSFISFLLSIPIELIESFFISILYTISIKYRFKMIYKIVLFLYNLG